MSIAVTASQPDTKGLESFLDEKELSGLLRVSRGTLRAWRCQSKGPRYRKIGQLVRYSPQDVREWLFRQPTGGSSLKAGSIMPSAPPKLQETK
jgi:hypothetical protein